MAELFRTAILFHGKHGEYAEQLSPDENDKKLLFNRIMDVYLIAPLVGFVYQRTAEKDGSAITKRIMSETIPKELNRLEFNYELIMILDKKSEPDINKRLDRAFRRSDESVKEGLDIFNSYARGGIEVLYEKLIENTNTPEDMADKVMDFLEEYQEKFLEDVGDLSELDLENL